MKSNRNVERSMMREYERDAQGDVIERVHTLPYRPEFLIFFRDAGMEHAEVEWKDPPITEEEEDGPWPTGELRDEADWPPAFQANLWALDERVCQRYGFTLIDVARVELPVLDYSSADPLTMRVFVRVPLTSGGHL